MAGPMEQFEIHRIVALPTVAGIDLSITNVTILDTTNAFIDGAATASADGGLGTFTDVLGDTHQGLSIEANSSENVVIVAVGGAFSSEGAGTGALPVTVIDVSASAYEEAPSVTPVAGAGISSLHDVDIAAVGHTSLVGVACALAGSSDDELQQAWTLRAGDHVITGGTKSSCYRHMFVSHMVHHRAQLGVYLRLLDLPVPGVYGPSADERRPA